MSMIDISKMTDYLVLYICDICGHEAYYVYS